MLLHREDQIVVIVVGACGARGRSSQIAELRAHSLQAAGGKRERGGQSLRSRLRRHNRLDKNPRRAVSVGGIVKVQRIRGESSVGPDRCRDRCRGAVRQRTTGGRNHDAVIGLVGVEHSGGAVSAGIVDGVRLIGFCAARDVIASEQQRRT